MTRVQECRHCGFCQTHECYEVSRDSRTWLRIVFTNWWENGWRIEVQHGETHPVGYGISWQKINELKIVMHPIPFNMVMRLCYAFVMWMHRGGWQKFPSTQDRINAAVARELMSREKA